MLIKISRKELIHALANADHRPIGHRCLYPNWRHSFVRAEYYQADKGEIGVTIGKESIRWYN